MSLTLVQGGRPSARGHAPAPPGRASRAQAPALGAPALKARALGEFAPSRLLWARDHRMMTRAELAQACGLSLSALAGYEQGRKAPSKESQKKLADALGVAPHFFRLPELDDVPEAAVSFRKASKSSKRHQRAARGDARMAVELFEAVEQHFTLPAPRIPSITGETPELAADLLRAEWHLGDRPIAHMMSLLESKGVRILSLDHRYKDIDAFCFVREEVPYVLVSTTKSGERQRFDLAHELGHLVMHSDDDEEVGSKEREAQANAFASAFLMPASRVRAQGMRAAATGRIVKAKAYWRVSAMAMTRRLHDLDLLTDWQYRSASIELTRQGYRSGEPGGIIPERSQLLRKVFQNADGHMSIHDASSALGLRDEDTRAYMRDLMIASA